MEMPKPVLVAKGACSKPDGRLTAGEEQESQTEQGKGERQQ